MKLLKAIYLSVIIIFIIQLYNRIIYGFETNNKIITAQTIEIGADGESYTLPSSIGTTGQILILNENGELEWGEVPDFDNLPTGEPVIYPYLRRENECPADTCFLPTRHREGEEARGYCMATSVSNADPLNCNDEQWAGAFSKGLTIRESFDYCRKNYGHGAITPTLNFFWPDLAYLIEPGYYFLAEGDPREVISGKGISQELEHFTEEENNSIQKFKKNFIIYAEVHGRELVCLKGPHFDSERDKGILTRDISHYALGCLSATVLTLVYCQDRNSTFWYSDSVHYPPVGVYDTTLGAPRPYGPRPFSTAEAPLNVDPNVMSSSSETQGMSQFRVLCIR